MCSSQIKQPIKPIDTVYQESKGRILKGYIYKSDTHWYVRYEALPKRQEDSILKVLQRRKKFIKYKF